MSDIRIAKRIPKSCYDCYRRRVKCDKKVPCNVCIKRGMADTCKKEKVIVNGKIYNGEEDSGRIKTINDELERLKRENDYLKAQLYMDQKEEADEKEAEEEEEAIPAHSNEYGYFNATVSLITKYQLPKHNKVQYTFEDFRNLGNFLTFEISQQLVDFNLREIRFFHCVILPQIFKEEHDRFFKSNNIIVDDTFDKTRDDYLWLAIYYAIIGNSFLILDADIIKELNVSEAQAANFGKTSMYACLECLNRGQYLQYPNIRSLQTFGILLTSASFFGTHLQNSLFSTMLYIARHLNLDKLTSPTEELDLLNFELSCRVWWLLVVVNWFEDSPDSRIGEIKLNSFTTPKPRNISDFNLIHGIEQETNHFLAITYNLCIFDICRFKKQYYFNDGINRIRVDKLPYLKYAHLNLQQLQQVMNSYVDTGKLKYAKYLIEVKLNHEILTVLRSAIAIKYNKQEDITSELNACHASSLRLIELFNDESYPTFYRKYWMVVDHCINASIFLLINNIMNKGSININTIKIIEIFLLKLHNIKLLENNPIVSGSNIVNKLIDVIKRKLNNEDYTLDVDEYHNMQNLLNKFHLIYQPKPDEKIFNDDYWNEFLNWIQCAQED